MTPETLREAVGCSAGNAILYAASLTTAMVEFGIETPEEQATFLSETAHESMLFSRVEENFNYTPGALLATFNTRKATRFTPATAQQYGRTSDHAANQPMIASIAYANRMGNGNIESGDGWRNRGAGFIQLTGERNHAACAKYFGLARSDVAAWLRTPMGASRGSGWFWKVTDLDRFDDDDDARSEALVINGGEKGRAERQALLTRALGVLKA